MLKAVITFFLISVSLTSCTNDPNGFLKRSANNKLFDTKGFHGSKRAPLYNKKYITQAKRNITKGNYEIEEEDYDSEEENISRENIEMYKELIKRDLEEKYSKKNNIKRKQKSFPSLVESKKNTKVEEHFLNLELKDELEQVKLQLDEAKKELEGNSICPLSSNNINNQKTMDAGYSSKFKPKMNKNRNDLIEDGDLVEKNTPPTKKINHDHIQSL